MKLLGRKLVLALCCSLLFAGALVRSSRTVAQSQSEEAQESVVSLQVTANDEIAAQNVEAHHVHLNLLRSGKTAHVRLNDPDIEGENGAVSAPTEQSPETEPFATATVPGVSAPGFYPADLSDTGHGNVIKSAFSNNVYVNCSSNLATAGSCWGTPSTFLGRLASSLFIHITDQYVGTTTNNRYPLGTGTAILDSKLPQTLGLGDISMLVHTAARAHGSGYDHIYHIFLRSGVNVCLSSTVCYSPNNLSTFMFCAFHGTFQFSDIGHVVYTVEPYQNVRGCAVAQPSPNGALVDSTSSTLSHELFESITDPDANAWFAQSSLIEYSAEIGDVCQTRFGKYGAFLISGRSYAIQPEYSNKYHACSTAP
jgi:hypothetical protein